MNTVLFKQGITQKMTTSKQFDYLNRLSSVSSAPSASSAVSSSYAYNDANQRTRATLADSSYWVYEYDTLGQVKSGKRYWSDGTPVAGQQFEYGFDDIGNRASTKAGGDSVGAGLRSATYTANTLATATVTVNSQLPYRRSEYFWKEVTVANGSVPVWQNNTVSVSGGPSASGNVFVPKTPENFTYDADGNEIADGHWSIGWDGENRVTWIGGATTLPAGSAQGMNCAYDWRSRRISKTVSNYTAGAWSRTAVSNFVYDGWNLIAILDGLNANALLYSFQWGTDLSGTLQGAGGVGGLISMRVHSGANAGTYFYAYDGNGNVTALVNATTGAIAAQYEYDPFGNLVRATGPMAFLNPFRFSTKYQDDETGFSYYGYRYYNASTGRWLSRDPIEEAGGLNLYRLLANSALNNIDPNGLSALWDTFIGCAWSIGSKWIDKKLDQIGTCGELYNRIHGSTMPNPGELDAYDIDLCKGFSFKPRQFNPNYEPASLAADIADCVLSGLKGKAIDVALKEITDPKKRKALKDLLDKAAYYKPEAHLEMVATAKCKNGKLNVNMKYSTKITVGGNSISTDPTTVGPFGCNEFLHMNDCCCS
ncbi:MAG: RHS repeat-associated core domain-containing protein, partial [Gammaproteobacteria bacterium]|nr:RHS repeat-associated core domain-containing protein [Gammaproteobacteria bacterium]